MQDKAHERKRYRVRRRIAVLNTIPSMQPVVEIMEGDVCVALMGSWSVLCLSEGAICSLDATDEQVLRAYMEDESVY